MQDGFGAKKKIGSLFAWFQAFGSRKSKIARQWKDYRRVHRMGFDIRLIDDCNDSDFIDRCITEKDGPDGRFESVASSKYASVKLFFYRKKKYVKKVFFHRDYRDVLKDIVRGPRAFRSLEGDLLLEKFGFHAPRCVMVAQKRRLSFAVSEFIDEAEDLDSLLKKNLQGPLDDSKVRLKRRIAVETGRLAGRLHAFGICHGDMRQGNILYKENQDGNVELWLLDNEGTFHYKKLPDKKRVKNLVQLNIIPFPVETISKTDRMRFFHAYLEQVPDMVPQKKPLAREVLLKTSVRLQKMASKRIRHGGKS